MFGKRKVPELILPGWEDTYTRCWQPHLSPQPEQSHLQTLQAPAVSPAQAPCTGQGAVQGRRTVKVDRTARYILSVVQGVSSAQRAEDEGGRGRGWQRAPEDRAASQDGGWGGSGESGIP